MPVILSPERRHCNWHCKQNLYNLKQNHTKKVQKKNLSAIVKKNKNVRSVRPRVRFDDAGALRLADGKWRAWFVFAPPSSVKGLRLWGSKRHRALAGCATRTHNTYYNLQTRAPYKKIKQPVILTVQWRCGTF